MQENNFINSALKVIQIEGKAILGLQDQIEEKFNDLCTNILATKGKLIIMGIGKSGHIAQKISATLSSTGTPSFFIHPTEAAHGDLGMIDKKDAILILSNSGETKEIIEILPALKRCAGSIFTLTNNADSTIAKIGDIHILIEVNEEACPLDLAPTSSTTLALVFGDALAISLLEHRGFTKDDFAKKVMEITNNEGVPAVFDGVGKNTFKGSLVCLKTRGMMVSFGNASGPLDPVNVPKDIQPKGLYLTRPSIGQYFTNRKELQAGADAVFEKVKFGKSSLVGAVT